MDNKEAKELTKEMKALRQAIEESNRLTSAVLKTSGQNTPQQPQQPNPFKGLYGG